MIENKSYYNKLFDCYSTLFTETQVEYFTSYFHDDLSLSEISENLHVTRAAISKQLKFIKEALDMYERELHLANIYEVVDFVCSDKSLSKEEIIKKLEEIRGE